MSLEKWDLAKGHRSDEFARYAAVIEPSGRFSIPDVPAGDYKFTAPIPISNPVPNVQQQFRPFAGIEFQITIPEIPGGSTDEPFDLEDIEAFVSHPLNAGDIVPDLTATSLRDGILKLTDYRGKLVLLDFWSPTNLTSVELMKDRQQVQERFKNDPRFAIIGIVCDDDLTIAKQFCEANGFSWPQGHVRGMRSRFAREYAVNSLPSSLLIGPDGALMSKNLDTDALALIIAATLRDDAVFAMPADQKPRQFPLIRYSVPSGSPLKKSEAAVVVVDKPLGSPELDAQYHYSLRLLTSTGQTIWERSRKNLAPTGGHSVFIDRRRNRIYVTEGLPQRLLAFDLDGNPLWHLERVQAQDVAVDEKTGNLWCCCGPSLIDGQTIVFDPQGTLLATYAYQGTNIAYDRHTDAFWLAAKDVTKIDRNGNLLFHKKVAEWTCSSVSVNPSNGQVWVVERKYLSMKNGKNRLWLFNSDGSVQRDWDFGERLLYKVACVPGTGDAWIGFVGEGGIRRIAKNGPMSDLIPMWVTQFSISPTTGEIWVATDGAVQKLDAEGKVVVRLPFAEQSLMPQAWLQAF